VGSSKLTFTAEAHQERRRARRARGGPPVSAKAGLAHQLVACDDRWGSPDRRARGEAGVAGSAAACAPGAVPRCVGGSFGVASGGGAGGARGGSRAGDGCAVDVAAAGEDAVPDVGVAAVARVQGSRLEVPPVRGPDGAACGAVGPSDGAHPGRASAVGEGSAVGRRGGEAVGDGGRLACRRVRGAGGETPFGAREGPG